jgi:AcrR family transcriptional regulator
MARAGGSDAAQAGPTPPTSDLWSRWASPAQQPKEGLTLQRITRAAIELADADGLAAVSMARVAKRCGFTTMALYRHVASKDELLLLMFNEAIGPGPQIPDGLDWAEGLRVWTRQIVEGLSASPWAVEINPTGLNTPGQLAVLDAGLQILDGTGMDYGDRANVLLVISGLAFSHVRLAADFGQTEAAGTFGRLLAAPELAERFPAVHALVASGAFEDDGDQPTAPEDVLDDLELGLELILDGLAVRLARQAAAREGAVTD